MKILLYKIIKRAMTHFGDIMLATEPPKTTAKQILDMQNTIQTGDVICRQYSYYLDSYFIPGEYTHSGIVRSKDEMVHSIAEGVCLVHPIDFIKDTDGFIILRPKYKKSEDINKVLARSEWHLANKTGYDFLFNDPLKFYCHEFTCDCLKDGGIEIEPSEVEIGFFPIKTKKTVYLAANIIDHCDILYEF